MDIDVREYKKNKNLKVLSINFLKLKDFRFNNLTLCR